MRNWGYVRHTTTIAMRAHTHVYIDGTNEERVDENTGGQSIKLHRLLCTSVCAYVLNVYTHTHTHKYIINWSIYNNIYIHTVHTHIVRKPKGPHLSVPLFAHHYPPGRDLTWTFHYLGQHCQIPPCIIYTARSIRSVVMVTAAAGTYSPGAHYSPPNTSNRAFSLGDYLTFDFWFSKIICSLYT